MTREALHDLALDRHEFASDEQTTLDSTATPRWMAFGVPFSVGMLGGVMSWSRLSQSPFRNFVAAIAFPWFGFALGREVSAAYFEDACLRLEGSALARVTSRARTELEHEARTRQYDKYADILHGVAKR